MNALSLNVLSLGYLDCQYFRIVDGYSPQTMYQSPVSALLIRHPVLGNILYDTGNSPFSTWEYGAHINEVYPVGKFVSIEQALAGQGLTCADIDRLILSHLHFDHAGGLRYFKGTKAIRNILVAKSELQEACLSVFTGQEHSAYVKSLFDIEGAVYTTVEDSIELAPDLKLFVQKAHTPGVLGLAVRTQSKGWVIATSDAVYTRESWDSGRPPGGPINTGTEAFLANLKRLRAMQEELGATMLFGHDSAQAEEWSSFGAIV